MSTSSWIWSAPHQDHYYVTVDEYNRPVYHWYKQTQVQPQYESPRLRQDSVDGSNTPHMPEPAPGDARTLTNFISGTPHTGWYDLLDASYRMRTGSEALQFFVTGRVFAMLYTETASESNTYRPNDDAYTIVRYNERAHTNIRRFVVVQVKRGFVYACGIGTYSGRGVLKDGYIPSDHAVIYLSGTDPATCYLPNEIANGITKEPIELIPADLSIQLRRESRIRFSKKYPIEMNVKVKDIGMIHPEHRSRLLQYSTDKNEDYSGEAQLVEVQSKHRILKSSPTPEPALENEDLALIRRDAQHHLSADDLAIRITGELHSDFQIINNPRGFFKKGLVFMVPWPEPSGSLVKDQVGSPVILKIRRFVVIRPKSTFCWCLPIHTYNGQATTKPGVVAQDHAAVIPEGGEVHYLPQEEKLVKTPLVIKVENISTGPIDHTSRINFAKVYTVEYNVKVCKVGRIVAESIWRMDQYFAECSKIGTS